MKIFLQMFFNFVIYETFCFKKLLLVQTYIVLTYLYMLGIMWPALPKPSTYAHYGKEQFSSSMDSSNNTLTNHQCTTAMGMLLLRFVSEACQTSTSAWVSIECGGPLLFTILYSLFTILAENFQSLELYNL